MLLCSSADAAPAAPGAIDLDMPFMIAASEAASRVMAGNPCRLNMMVYRAAFVKKRPPVKREHQVACGLSHLILCLASFLICLSKNVYRRCAVLSLLIAFLSVESVGRGVVGAGPCLLNLPCICLT